MRKLGILIIVLMSLIIAVDSYAVSLTIPAGGSTLTESEYDSNNNLVETAVSQLDAVDSTKHDKTKFTEYSTFQATVSDSKVSTSTFTDYSTYQATIIGWRKHYQYVDTTYSTYSAVNAVVPLDDTIPAVTEGRSVMSTTVTPTKSGTELQVAVDILFFMPTINKHAIGAIFVNNTCIDVQVKDSTAANMYQAFCMEGDYTVWSTTAVPVEFRMGTSDGTTVHINGNASSRLFGGASEAHLGIRETD